MTGHESARLIYLVLLLCAVGGIFVGASRKELGQMAKYALIWGGVFVALLAGMQFFVAV